MFVFSKDQLSPRLVQIQSLSLFSTLSPRELKVVDGLLHERNYLKGEIIFDEGEEGQALYIVMSGKVLICRQGQPVTGKLVDRGPGMQFGELALLDDAPRAAQVRAEENSTLAVFFRADFLGLLETHAVIASRISLQLARHIGRNLREAVAGAPTQAAL